MSTLIRIPHRFFNDHRDRDLPTPEVVRWTNRHLYIRLDDPATPELLNDAEYYADPWGPDGGIGLRSSAKATAKAIRAASKIKDTNGFRPLSLLKRIARDERVQMIEGLGMDHGVVFVHLQDGYIIRHGYDQHSFSCDSADEAKYFMKLIERV